MKCDANPMHLARSHDFGCEALDVLFPIPSPTIFTGNFTNFDGFQMVSCLFVDDPQLVESCMTRRRSAQRLSQERRADSGKTRLLLECLDGFWKGEVVQISEPVEELADTLKIEVKLNRISF